ncbi:MAG: cyclic nucleotide-binding domain-containing protein [Alphaproteobacteria bacterium]|nr:cyclic nucleotide-binding domain-containing protein [Alphaproteobacteria bacterium]
MGRPRIFDGLNDIDVATAERRFTVRKVAAGEEVIREGEVGRAMACVVSGELVIQADGAEVGRVSAGAVLGEMGLFEDSPRTASASAAVPTELWVLERSGYEELRDTLHPICMNIEIATLEAQVHRLDETGRKVASLGLGVPTAVAPPSGFFAAVARLFGAGGTREVRGDAMGALMKSPLFGDAPEPAVQMIADLFDAVQCEAGEFLCTEGEQGDSMFVLEKGEVDVVVNMEGTPHQVDSLEPGSAFGMVSLARGGKRMASCVARSGALVHRLGRDGWDALVNEPYMVGSTFRRAVIRAFSDQLRYSNQQLAKWEKRVGEDYGLAIDRARRALSSHDRKLKEG